ncbi:MAG: SIS domain-containing protein [Anaerolineae bacterium]
MADTRTSHPYYMYDAIQAQPRTWSEVVARTQDEAHRLAVLMTGVHRVFLVGTGTSLHAAQAGEMLLRAFASSAPKPVTQGKPHVDPWQGDLDYRAMSAFDFALYGPSLNASDAVIVISHRGTKSFSVKSLERAHEQGCRTILVTGQGPHAVPTPGLIDHVLIGSAQEDSSAHTFSFTASVAILSVLAQQLGRIRKATAGLTDELLKATIPQAIKAALATEGAVAELVRSGFRPRVIRIVGGGPAAIVATEAALKIRETSYLQAEGMSTETMIHGPMQSADWDDLFIVIAPQGPARARTLELVEMIKEIGAWYILVTDGPVDKAGDKALAVIQAPPVPEPFTVLTCLIPLQLASYHLALVNGRNPDIFRKDDERFARASARITL